MSENIVTEAFNIAKERYDSMAVVLGLLNVSATYAYAAMKEGELSLPCSIKMEMLLDGEIRWQDLCPKHGREMDKLEKLIAQY